MEDDYQKDYDLFEDIMASSVSQVFACGLAVAIITRWVLPVLFALIGGEF